MSSGNMNHTAQKKVIPVGDAWIVTPSKSHPGYVYYFNTITRQAVWNLSESEIEKARLATQLLESSSGPKPALCPEPKENPPTQRIRTMQFPHQGQIFNGYVSQEQQQIGGTYNEMHQPNNNVVQSQNQAGAVYPGIPITDMSTFDFNALQNQVNAINVLSAQSVYNPNVFTIPHPQQFIITPTIPVVNQNQGALTVRYNPLIRDNALNAPTLKHFNNTQNSDHRFDQSKNNVGQSSHWRSRLPLQYNDLRQRLSLKRKLCNRAYQTEEKNALENSSNDTPVQSNVDKKTADVSSCVAATLEAVPTNPVVEKVDYSRTDDREEKSSTQLDLTPLKSLAGPDDNVTSCCIVIDKDVLLKEFNYLMQIIDSDEHCNILVPDSVMSELKEYIACTNNIPARRIFHALSKKIESGRVSLGNEPKQNYGDSITNPILKTCFELLEENVNVILLTNDSELLRCKKFIKVNIVTVNDFKSLLTNTVHQDRPKINDLSLSKDLIKISKTSNQISATETNAEESTCTKSVDEVPTRINNIPEETTHMENVSKSELSSSENGQSPGSTKLSKSTIDAAIQTDTVDGVNDSPVEMVNAEVLKNLADNSDKSNATTKSSSNIPVTDELKVTTPVNRRELRLRRSISNNAVQPSSVVSNNGKKPFRWRRKKQPDIQTAETAPDSHEFPPDIQNKLKVSPVHGNKLSNDNINHDEEHLDRTTNNENETEHTSCLDEVVESRESSVICMSVRRENVTIEETSTSGVVSNTESNVDTLDSEYMKPIENHHIKTFYEHNFTTNIMRIDNDSMEDSLKTNCEEWVSRFLQIMEDALAMVLHKEPAFANSALPPPWTLHEAAQCLGKYSNVAAVKCASDKLSNVLFHLSDSMGKIPRNMTPSQYMEMYTYGVSLLKEVKSITSYKEDIALAEESLQKLLADIKNPHYGTETDLQERERLSDTSKESIGSNKSQGKKTSTLNESQNEKELTSSPKIVTEEPQQQSDKTIRNLAFKSSFLSSLELKKVVRVCPNIIETKQLCNRSGDGTNERKQTVTTFSSCDPDDESQQFLVHGSSSIETPNIVRNFRQYAEFEQKLMNKFNVNACDDEDYLDNEDDYECTSAEYTSRSEEFDMLDDNTMHSDPNITQLSLPSDIEMNNSLVTSSPMLSDSTLATKSNNTFKLMMHIFLQEIRNAVNEVKILCDTCYAELNNPQLPTLQRNELKYQLEKAQIHILGLCTSLNSMLDRNPNAPTDNIQTAMKNAGIDILHVDEHLLLKYWNTIASCKKHADVFLLSIQEILAGFKCLGD